MVKVVERCGGEGLEVDEEGRRAGGRGGDERVGESGRGGGGV